ncbi:acyltransferase family protein [Carboxylicivirga marina]|uniref:acyltransferase family protein n=1 Tax=Carboxylicivirga marina TaxID=2800988 RepID=UPI002592DC90|nr:acyltransferase [uncultured Carboxylicivirga sp.]
MNFTGTTASGFLSKGSRVLSLDVLRGLMALVVVIYHIPQLSRAVGLPHFVDWPIFNRGTEAVKVFFTLSGYLIIGLLFDEKRNFGSINIYNFYIRRILRLYPVYYVVLIFGLVYYHFLLPFLGITYDANYKLLEAIVLNVVFLPNVFAVQYEPGSILLILWSIGIEEQFYLLIAPLLALLASKRYAKVLLLFTLIYCFLFHSYSFPFLKQYWFYYYYMSAGGFVAVMTKMGYHLSFNKFLNRLGIYLVFTVYFITDWLKFSNVLVNEGVATVLFSVLIVNLVMDDIRENKYPFMRYLGKISYGIYMYHMIVLNLVLFIGLKLQGMFNLSSLTSILFVNITCLTGTILVSHFSYKYFESYFLILKLKFRK